MPGLIKIGHTTGKPWKRAAQLGTTGVAYPFEVVHSITVMDNVAVERNIHRRLDKYRVSQDREFFQISEEHAVQELNKHTDPAIEAAKRERKQKKEAEERRRKSLARLKIEADRVLAKKTYEMKQRNPLTKEREIPQFVKVIFWILAGLWIILIIASDIHRGVLG